MAPQMAAPEAAISQAESTASAGMQQVGLDYLAQTMGGIDAATDAKGLIDALRGNNKPLEARYAELAQLVGEQDAMQTPESVLALVQPTIMMTEQGAVDSGVGELMQNIIGQVEMETEEGAPTPMAGGLGSLMAAGAPAAMEAGQPPVQNFRYGGLVQRFQTGGEAQGRLGQLYSEMLPIYQSVLGPGGSEEAKAQALFAIAQAAGQFAAGRGPQGEDLRGASPAAAFAANLGGLSGSLQQQAAARGQEERALRLAALQGAQQEYSAERAAARAAAGRETPLGSFYDIVDAEGNVIETLPAATRGDFAALQARVPEGGSFRPAFQKDVAKFDVLTLYGPDGKPKTFNISSATGAAEANQAIKAGYTDVAPAGSGFEAVEFYRVNPETGVPETKTVNVGTPAGIQTAEELSADGWSTSNMLAQEALDQSREIRAEQALIREEERALGRRLNEEERDVLREADKFLRDQAAQVAAEDRAEARQIAMELRQRGFAMEDRDLDLAAELAREERALGRKLTEEERIARMEQLRFERDEGARKEAENREYARVIETELRQRGFALEDRDLDLVAELAREERAEGRVLSAEERAARLEELRFKRNEDAKIAAEIRLEGYQIAAELRNRGYALEDRDYEFAEEIAREERALERALSAEERAARLEELRFERAEASKLAAEDRARANAAPQLFTLYPPEGGAPRDLNGTTPEGRSEINRLIDLGWSSKGPSAPGTMTERQQALLADPVQLDRWQKGQLSAGEENKLVITLQDYITPQRDITGATTQRPIPESIQSILRARQERGLTTYGIDPALFEAGAAAPEAPQKLGEIAKQLMRADLEAATGLLGSVQRGINLVVESTVGELVPGVSGTVFVASEGGANALDALAQATSRFYIEGRTLAREFENLERELVRPRPGMTDAGAQRQLATVRASLADQMTVLRGIVSNPRDYSPAEISNARKLIAYGDALISTYDSALGSYGAGGAERPRAEDFFRD
jgi:hypothetical protein